ncbi:MAG TPA: spore coat protein [Bacillota bacterium]|nr:spore coat protein [Bacillota bacterium]
MAIQLGQKERMLLEDQKKHEEICIKKYNNYAAQASDPQLKQLFSTYAGQEQQHYDTINQILAGQMPGMGQQKGQQQQQMQQAASMGRLPAGSYQNDAALCNDMLMTEKYVSNTYDTAIFEMADTNVRQALNHIQKEEQQHGEGIFNYMKNMGMYQPQ